MSLFDLFFLLDNTQISFIVIVSIVGGVFLLTIISIPIIGYFRKKKYRELSYFKIRDVVLNNDFYLINNFKFKIDDNTTLIVDHIIGGEKYFYIISDYYFGNGSLTGNINDQSLIYTNKKGKKSYTDNPITLNKKLVSKLSNVTGIDPSLMIGIVLINNSCFVNVLSSSKQFYAIEKKKLDPLIRAIESRNIAPINEDELASAFKTLQKIKLK